MPTANLRRQKDTPQCHLHLIHNCIVSNHTVYRYLIQLSTNLVLHLILEKVVYFGKTLYFYILKIRKFRDS